MNYNHVSETTIWAYVSKSADIATIQKVEYWINSASCNEKLFNEITAVYNATGENTIINNIEIDEAKNLFYKSVGIKKNKQHYRKNIFKYVAAFILTITTAIYMYFQFSTGNEQIHVQTTFGEQKQINLPDGSVAWLNASSILSYNLKSPRSLYLEGEAFFEVVKYKNTPFIVSTQDNLQIKALGTSFNIKSYTPNFYTETVLFTGKVEISSNKHFKKKIILLPNDKVTFFKKDNHIVKSTLKETTHTIAWKKGEIKFSNKPFKEIANNLNIQYNVKIYFENEVISNSKFTGSFNQSTPINEILEILKASKHFEFKQLKDNVWSIK